MLKYKKRILIFKQNEDKKKRMLILKKTENETKRKENACITQKKDKREGRQTLDFMQKQMQFV